MQTECAGSRQKYASPQRPEEAVAASDIKRQADSRQQTTQTGKECAQAADMQQTVICNK